MLRFFRMLQRAFWRGFEHGCFNVAKAAAYSCILTFFPALMVLAAIVDMTGKGSAFATEVMHTLGVVLPPGAAGAARQYFERKPVHEVRLLISAVNIMLLAASGVMISWMQGFRGAYHLHNPWGFWKERGIALGLVLLSIVPMTGSALLVGFGHQVEHWMMSNTIAEWHPLVYIIWTLSRWSVALLTSVMVIASIYYFGVPRVQRWYEVLPGALVATGMWAVATSVFGWYVKNYATYNVLYGSLGAGIALLVWMYITSVIVVVGAEFNAMVLSSGQPFATGFFNVDEFERELQVR
jgi:membrane protein